MEQAEFLTDLADVVRRAAKYYRIFLWAPRLDRRFRRTAAAEYQAAQWEQFQALVRHAATNVPFYRELYASSGSDWRNLRCLDDIRQLPIVTKEDLRRNFPDRLVVDARRVHPSDYGRSSGSTGEAVQFVHQHSWKRTAYYCLLWHRQGLLSSRTAFLMTPQCSATSCSLTDRRETFEDQIRGWLLRTRLNSYFHLPSSTDIFRETDDYFAALLAELQRNRAEILVGAPNYWGQLARYLLRTRQRFPVRAAVCYSELLLASVKQEISQAFECPVYNHYGAGETPGVADECPAGGWHLRVDINHVEILRENGQPCDSGEVGRLLVTPLDNYRMPLIRYEVGDLATWRAGPCACGRKNPTLLRIDGRTRDAWRDVHGQLVSPAAVGEAACRAGVRGRYRLIQQTLNEVDLEWVQDDLPRDAESIVEKLACELVDLLGTRPRVEIQPVRYIAPEKSNKYRLIFSHVRRLPAGSPNQACPARQSV